MNTQEVRIRSLELSVQLLTAGVDGNVVEVAGIFEQFINRVEDTK